MIDDSRDPVGPRGPTGSRCSPDPLARVASALRCPVCEGEVRVDGRAVRCARGHAFDRARQGYAALLAGPLRFHGDDAPMIAARRSVLDSGLYDPLLESVGRIGAAALGCAEGPGPATVVDLGCGTGHYAARVLDAAYGRAQAGVRGIGVDASKAAVRAAARAHPSLAALLADAWSRLPLADGCADVMMSVFAPRNPGAYARVVRRAGTVMIVTPEEDHLRELVAAAGLLRVGEGKGERLAETMRGCGFAQSGAVPVRWRMRPGREHAAAMAAMGPSAHHLDEHRRAALVRALPDGLEVTGAVTVRTYRRA